MRKMLTLTIMSVFVNLSSGSVFAEAKNVQSSENKPAAETKNAKKQRAKKAAGEKNEETKPAEDLKKQDAADQLIKGSTWRGDRWRGQNQNAIEGPQPSNEVKVTMREGDQVTLTANKWEGAQGKVHWTFTINGKQLVCTSISFTGGGGKGIFEEIKGGGTIDGEVLQFEVSARQKSPKFNGIVHEKLVLKKAG